MQSHSNEPNKPNAIHSNSRPSSPNSDHGQLEEVLERKIEELRLELQALVLNSKEDAYKLGTGTAVLFFGIQAVFLGFIVLIGQLISFWAAAILTGALFIFAGLYLVRSSKETIKEQNERLKEKLETLRKKFYH